MHISLSVRASRLFHARRPRVGVVNPDVESIEARPFAALFQVSILFSLCDVGFTLEAPQGLKIYAQRIKTLFKELLFDTRSPETAVKIPLP